MYTFKYDVNTRPKKGDGNSSHMVFHAKMYSIADKYDCSALKFKAKERFEITVKDCWDNGDFPDAVAQVYDSSLPSDQGLRKVLVDAANEHIKQLLPKQNFCDTLLDTVGFAAELVHTLARTKTNEYGRYHCSHCNKTIDMKILAENTWYYCIHCGNHHRNWPAYIIE